jgi:hypothetical protein
LLEEHALLPDHFITNYNTANLHYDFGRHFTWIQEILRKGALLRHIFGNMLRQA